MVFFLERSIVIDDVLLEIVINGIVIDIFVVEDEVNVVWVLVFLLLFLYFIDILLGIRSEFVISFLLLFLLCFGVLDVLLLLICIIGILNEVGGLFVVFVFFIGVVFNV